MAPIPGMPRNVPGRVPQSCVLQHEEGLWADWGPLPGAPSWRGVAAGGPACRWASGPGSRPAPFGGAPQGRNSGECGQGGGAGRHWPTSQPRKLSGGRSGVPTSATLSGALRWGGAGTTRTPPGSQSKKVGGARGWRLPTS